MPPELTPSCSDLARRRGEPLIGSAPQVRGWLLLEHPGPWRAEAVAESRIEPAVLAELTGAADRAGVRVLLIRRPGRDRTGAERHWRLTLLDGPTWTGPWRADADLHAAINALSRSAAPSPAADRLTRLLLVCTHGVRNACCAVRGRPVAAALAQRWPGEVWECTHLGGDRFAANLLVLPDGFYYGNLDPELAVGVVESHLRGEVPAGQLRGMGGYPPAVQAAAGMAYAQCRPLPPGAVEVLSSQTEGGQTRVRLAVPGGTAAAEVSAHQRPAARLSCRNEHETSAVGYTVTSFELAPRG